MTRNQILRNIIEDDLPIFFEQHLDSTANYMAAFTAKDPSDKDAFTSHWTKIMELADMHVVPVNAPVYP